MNSRRRIPNPWINFGSVAVRTRHLEEVEGPVGRYIFGDRGLPLRVNRDILMVGGDLRSTPTNAGSSGRAFGIEARGQAPRGTIVIARGTPTPI
jgi:hypothetical protein